MDFALLLDSESPLPLHRQLYDQLRAAILDGRLAPGTRLPSTRELARTLHISRTTAALGYDQLLSEGYLEARRGSGTFVCTRLPEALLQSRPPQPPALPPSPGPALSRYALGLATIELRPQFKAAPAIRFNYGSPDFGHLPLDQWRQLLVRHCRSGSAVLDYVSDGLGYLPLRAAIARYLARARAVRCSAENVLIVNGSQHALDLCARLLVDPGDAVALEEPGYLGARHVFRACGARLLPIPVDAEGLVVEKLVEPARLVYVTPSHQFPSGSVLSLARRLALIARARASGALILEDDYDSEYRYAGRPIPALQSLDSGSVIYMGTFSKVLFPSLRLGYLVLPPALVTVFARARWLTDRQSALLEQYALCDFIEAGHLERHIRKMRRLYALRRAALVTALAEQLGDRCQVLGEAAGMHVLIRLKTGYTDSELIARAAAEGVGLESTAANYLATGPGQEFLLGFTALTDAQIGEGVRRLARAARD